MKENYKVRSPWKTLLRAKIGFPLALLSCSLFFFAGFFASMLFSQDVPSEGVGNVKLLEELGSNWPAIPHGVTGEPYASSIPFQVLSWKPRALYFPNFASPEKCEAIVRHAKTKLQPSTLALRKGETEETTKGIRTSSGTFLSASQDPSGSLAWVEKKIAKVTMIPREHGEPFNVLRYELGQQYASHYDAFNPAEYGPQQSLRVATFLLYLSDVEEGGETMFPFENGANMDIEYDYEKCIGLKVKPRKGDGLLFYSLMINGTIDPPLNECFAAFFNYVTIVISLVRRLHPAMHLMALAYRSLDLEEIREGNGVCRILIFLLDCARVSSNEKDGIILYTSCGLRAKSAMKFLLYLSKAASRIKPFQLFQCYAEVQLWFSPVAIRGTLHVCESGSEWFCNLINTEQFEYLHPLNNCAPVDVTA